MGRHQHERAALGGEGLLAFDLEVDHAARDHDGHRRIGMQAGVELRTGRSRLVRYILVEVLDHRRRPGALAFVHRLEVRQLPQRTHRSLVGKGELLGPPGLGRAAAAPTAATTTAGRRRASRRRTRRRSRSLGLRQCINHGNQKHRRAQRKSGQQAAHGMIGCWHCGVSLQMDFLGAGQTGFAQTANRPPAKFVPWNGAESIAPPSGCQNRALTQRMCSAA